MKCKILSLPDKFPGCDFVVELGKERINTEIKLLQLTDIQLIDATQRRTEDRLRSDEIAAWQPEFFMQQCGNHILSLITQTKPDLIFITGDIVYGSFDDNGTVLKWICDFMDSLDIPWAPVFGNHDNESYMGVEWQCEMLENCRNCMFKRGIVTGNGNYTVGISVDGELIRALYMADTHGCLSEAALKPDQLNLFAESSKKISEAQGKAIPGFMAFHIPTESFNQAACAKGYKTDERPFFTIGVDVPQLGEDYGFCQEKFGTIKTECDFIDFLHSCNIDGVFTGHCHNICTCIDYENIKFAFGLKTGQYDYHVPGNIGGTLVLLDGSAFKVQHIPTLVQYAPMPHAGFFKDWFV